MGDGRRTWRWSAAACLVLLGAAGLLLGRNAALVDWREVRAVALESDDWGLCGFFPDSAAMAGLTPEALETGDFPAVYWGSTLEDSAAVAALAAVLAGIRGRDGEPAVLQPNYILSSLAWEDGWVARDLPALPPAYARPGLWAAVAAARQAGVWYPELHGRWHFDPTRRRANALSSAAGREAARRQVLLFPASEQAWELGPWRSREELAGELDGSLRVFGALFGRPPRAVIAPDYRWDDRCEDLWRARGLTTIQAKRSQRRQEYLGEWGRWRKLVDRTLARQWRRDRVYLERNVYFEPVQNDRPELATREALRAIQIAWGRGEPAVVETHRINFAHLDRAVATRGREELAALGASLGGEGPQGPIFLVDGELAGLQRSGTCWSDRGDRRVTRNLTRSRRLLVVPGSRSDAGARGPEVVSLGPGETRIDVKSP